MKPVAKCQATLDGLESCSHKNRIPTCTLKVYLNLRHKGLGSTSKLIWARVAHICRIDKKHGMARIQTEPVNNCQDALSLKPRELVEVKSEHEVLATLDAEGKNRGLLWMRGMSSFCGKKYRVFKRVETILLESNGELRKMKNTVLLEGVMCDGSEFFGCDRSCFHYWREVWLRRVETPVD